MSVSIYDIAERAHVSPSTVSRALQDHPRIAAKTKQRILEIAREMDYIPSAVARSLTSNQTLTVGLVVASISDSFTGRVIEGVEEVAIEAGFNVFLNTSQNDRQREIEVIKALQQRRIDGIIVISSHLFDRYSSYVGQIKTPVVMINEQQSDVSFSTVAVDDIHGARMAVEHLIALGHRRIGYIGISNRPKSNRHRLKGYQDALLAAGIPLDPALISMSPDGDDHVKRGEISLDALLAAGVTAAFCYNDAAAIELLSVCYKRKIAVPDAFSVIGFDDIDFAAFAIPPLTTIRQPRFGLGQRAMRMMLALLNREKPVNEILYGELIVRETTAPLETTKR